MNEIFGKEMFLKEHVLLLLQLISKVVELIQEQGISIGKTLSGEKILKELFKLNTREEIVQWFQERLFEPVTQLLAKQAESQYIHIGSRVLEMIHTGYEQDLSLEACAAALNYHPVYLSRVFKKHVGVPFSDYLTEYRMNAAKSMLESTQMKISEIGERLQYKNTSAFIRTFRRSVGMTPGSYRELHQKK
ncbi:HTH-type transcriptional regulator YesS [compost metagenome]